MEDDCQIIGNVTKSRKIDETINIVDEENDSGQAPKKIKNPFKVKKSKSKKRKCRADSSTGERNDSAIIKSNFLASYVSDGMNYSISETEIHHLANGVKLASRGVNTEQQPAVVNTCCCQNGHQGMQSTQVGIVSPNNLNCRGLSNEILDLSNGLVLNELQNMGEVITAKSLEPNVPNDYIDLKGKGKFEIIRLINKNVTLIE